MQPLQDPSSTVGAPGALHLINALPSLLASDENVLATLEVDLDARQRFAPGLLVLTDRRLLAGSADGWADWPLTADLALRHTDHAGVGTIEMHDAHRRLAQWRFTLAANVQALQWMAQVERQLDRLHRSPPDDADDAFEPDDFSREATEVPSTWVLLRLGRFAKPYRKQLIAGFSLTLASTAATLVPPYLTIPLMDDVLIPFQNGQRIDTWLVVSLLAGLLGSALLAWGLGWARTWLLALVSERIAADLRTAAFEHLLRLSLDYFGAKRTGDLIARIGSETDRISVFLSLHALDFATDVLMIGMTSAILFSINPWLALVTLLPLPFIAWMIHLVRDRLRTGFEKIDRVWGDVTNVLADTIPGIRVVKAFAQERREA
ncbi:MAG: ABC transporter, partial [Aquincola sp.]|nr:ABC transporter [Aquincola sp.]